MTTPDISPEAVESFCNDLADVADRMDDAGRTRSARVVTDAQAMLRVLRSALTVAEKQAAYYKWRLDEIIPLFEEARDALPAITTTALRLYGISPTLADRMDVAGTRTREQFDAK